MINDLHTAKQKSLIINILKGLVFTSLLGLLFLYNMNRPRIMVIHSYDPTMDMVKDFDNGAKKILEQEIEPIAQNYYMNMLNKNTIKQKISTGDEAKAAIDRFHPKILIAVGDEAQEFAAKFYLGRKKIKVIFAGVKGDIRKFGYEPGKNVGGITEVPQIQELNTLINYMFPGKKNIRLAHLGDTSTIVHLTEKILINHSWKNVEFLDSVRVNDSPNFKKAVTLLNECCDVLLISSYRGLKKDFNEEDGVISAEIMKWVIDNTSVPIISTFGYVVEEGADASIVSSGYEQGMLAMESALTMLDNPSYFPNLSSKIFSVFINDSHKEKCRVIIPPLYRSFAVSTQKLFGCNKNEATS